MTDPTADRPLVTFALFAYNQEQYIREAVEGAFSQTYEPLEIILSDDCSSDRTYQIMQEMAAAYEGPHEVRVRQTQENVGTLNHVLDVAKQSNGEIMVVAAGDDVSRCDRCTLIQKEFSCCDTTFAVYSSFELVDETLTFLSYRKPAKEIPKSRALLASGKQLHIFGATSAYKTCMIANLPFASEKVLVEDFVLSLFLQVKGGKNRLVDEGLVKCRSHSNNLWGHGRVDCNNSESLMVAERHEMAKAKAKLSALLYIKENNYFKDSRRRSVGIIERKFDMQVGFYDLKSRWDDLSIYEKLQFIFVSQDAGGTKYAISRAFGKKCFLLSRLMKSWIQTLQGNI